MTRRLACLALPFVLAGTLLRDPAPATAHDRTIACEGLAEASLPFTRITLAQANPASTAPAAPAHCQVQGRINERIGQDGKPYAIAFHLRLPVDWNGRLFFQGGGGLDGNLGNALGSIGTGQTTNAVSLGYAVVSTDAGHTPEPVPGVGGALFGLDPQARVDYGYHALDVVTRTAKRILRLHYGQGPRYSYFVGCSNGGRQGMVASQRFPGHFDGIVAGDPGFRLPQAAVAEAWDSQVFAALATQLDVGGQPYLPTTFSTGDLALVAQAVLARCDALDGLADGIIDDLPSCRLDPAELQCPGAKDATCLSPEQVAALQKVFRGARNSRGRVLYSDWPYDAGIGDGGWRVWKLGFPAPPGAPLVNNAINVTLGATALPYVFVTPPDPVPAADLVRYMLEFDFDRDAPRIFHASGIYTESPVEFMTAASTDLREFRRRGNKLIIYHGASDPVFSVNDTIRWYRRLAREAPGRVDRFVRLFVIPGMTHCAGGPATDAFDALAPIVEWVEHGRAPEAIVATARATSPWPGRTRPLCPYPAQARYTGSGDIDNAGSFVCRLPHGRPDRYHHDHDHDGADDHHAD
jgi:feruloyl esterase